jgi:hypothetical protein
MKHFSYFLKPKEFAYQVEYRLLWLTDYTVDEYIDIKVPEAAQYCDKPNKITQ